MFFAMLSICLSNLCSIPSAQASEPQPDLKLAVTGEATFAFIKSRDSCDPVDIPDAPARAIRTARGDVQLYAPHFRNRRLTGPDLLHLSTDCRVVFEGQERDDPAAFNDREWITSLYTPDGQTIIAAIHNEFQGHRRLALCPSGRYLDCWYNTIVAAVSSDAGEHFTRVAEAGGLIAALPYRYAEVTGHHVGYFNPSNMILDHGLLYMMVFATEVRAQKAGNCLLRNDAAMKPSGWRGWDGQGFVASFIDPYTFSGSGDPHVCAPVGGGQLRWPVTSLVRHQPSGLFIALMMNGAHDGGIYYATSRDMIVWSSPEKLMDGLGEGGFHCGDPMPIAYPSLIDPDSTDRNFMIVGPTVQLFLTRFNLTGCKTSMDRDLVRIPVAITARTN